MKETIEDLQALFSGYRLERRIAHGGSGAIYRAYQKSLDRSVAIKILPRELSQDATFRERFTAEARAMARLNHPNLIGVYDFGDVEGLLYVVKELVEGASLHDAAADGPVDPVVVVELVSGICRGLSHAHEHGILHRDLNPSNILLDPKFMPKIGDFGLVREIGKRQGQADAGRGTPRYTAPEVTAGNAVDHRADLFSAGALLYRLLTGREPGNLPLPRPSSLCGSPPVLDRIVAKATQFHPEDRFRDADEFVKELERASRQVSAVIRPARAAPVRIPAPSQPPTPTPSAAPGPGPLASTPAAQPVQPERNHRARAGLLAVAILLALGIASAFFVTRKKEDRQGGDASRAPATQPIKASTEFQKREAEARPTTPVKQKEPVLRALARLKKRLVAGSRDEFPEGTVTREGKAYLLVDVDLSWEEAEYFAEAHGAHLAVLPGATLQNWFREHFSFERPIWVGAGKSANDRWQWIDGSVWSEDDQVHQSLADQHHLALSRIGGLFPSRAQNEMQFALVWHADGSNPGTKGNQLRRFAAAVKAGAKTEAIYPVGTRTFNDSHFYYHEKELSWDDARIFADSLGGYLAAPSGEAEQAWIATVFSPQIREGQVCWLGGFILKPNDRWQWLSRESWNNSGWAEKEPGSDPGLNRLVMAGHKSDSARVGWMAGDGALGVAQGMLLEWSPPTTPVAVKTFELTAWQKAVNQRMANQVGSTLDEFDKKQSALLRDYYRSMKRIARKEEKEPSRGRDGRGRPGPGGFRRPWDQRRSLEEIEEQLEEAEEAGRMIAKLPQGAAPAFGDQQAESQKAVLGLEDTYDLKLAEHREFYAQGILQKAEELREIGYLATANELASQADSLRDNNTAFLAVLFGGTPREELPWNPRTKPDVPVRRE